MNILSVRDVSKRFGKRQVLKSVSFDIPKGAIVGLIGPNGVGKSTIMKIILGIYKADSGTVSSKGTVGALIESPAIYPFLTGRQQLMLYSHQNAANVNVIVKEMAMTKYIDKRVVHYSLGMKQKMGIASALLNHPDVVILDEPMNGLDPMSNRELRDLIMRLAEKGISFLISSHILSELEKMIDQVVLLDKGQVILATSMKHLHAIGANYLFLKTDDDTRCTRTLIKDKISATKSQNGVQVPLSQSSNLNQLFNDLLSNKIKIEDVGHFQENLEDSVLTMMANESRGKDR
ncbi:ABC transporter ATP-binding protein [Lentilactobacillus raoultii]|uniref:ABC transporter ATP-binding protein n=1 Tax=Lentilactobacillus raoultii TaxID=1987503 RepID=A0ABW3PQH9_9LACO|nr:ATP-binding cassette domain-containing protein [Lentilactobacillus raoultii]